MRYIEKELIDKSKECHNDKPQPTPDTKGKRTRTEMNAYKRNKQLREKHIDHPCSKYLRPTSFGQKYEHFMLCKQMDIFQEQVYVLVRLPQRRRFWLL